MSQQTGAADDGHTQETVCLNCRATLIGEHCHVCGQRAHVHRTLGAFFHDLLHGVLHFEGKTWRTLPMLAWRPGELTRRYIDGERARFVSPLALFLFSVFLMFAVFSTLGAGSLDVRNTRGEVAATLRHAQADLSALEQQASGLDGDGGVSVQGADDELGPLDDRIAAARRAVAQLASAEQSIVAARGVGPRANLPGWPGIEKGLNKLYENPSLAIYKLQNNAYKFSWLLIPITVPLVWLLFAWRRKHWQLYDHTVFVTYALTFQSLLLILYALLIRVGVPSEPVTLVFALALSAHVFRQFRGAYGLRWFSAFWRMLAFTIVFGTAVVLFAIALIVIGATG